jgi:hypothetical protein
MRGFSASFRIARSATRSSPSSRINGDPFIQNGTTPSNRDLMMHKSFGEVGMIDKEIAALRGAVESRPCPPAATQVKP